MLVETLRVHFLTTSAGSDGVRQAGTTHDLPEDEARRLIDAGEAVEADAGDKPEIPSESAPLQTGDFGPFSDDEWAMGITLEEWAQWRAPDVYAQRKANPAGILIVGAAASYEESASEALRRTADAALQGQLGADLASGVLVLCIPPDTADEDPRKVSPAALPEMLEGISGSYDTFTPFYRNKPVELRLYKAEQFTEIDRTTSKDEIDGSKGKSNEGTGPDRAPKGKQGRKPKWDWDGATREMMRLANSPDGLPEPQAKLEKAISNWFSLNNEAGRPSTSQIRAHVVKYLPPDYRPE